ncbi:MAG TPA: DUF5655 domain-containing protein [Bacillota bacterium]|nr:DUF5655 domain-containing protein [Bacillota bacterium]
MGNVKLFWINEQKMEELRMEDVALSGEQKSLIERNISTMFGLRLITGDYQMSDSHSLAIDTLALDANDHPVIVYYRRPYVTDTVNRGLSAMAWLHSHHSEFQLLVMHHLGQEVANRVEWAEPRLFCISDEYTKFELSTAALARVSTELIRYCFHGENLLLIERLALPDISDRVNPFQQQIDRYMASASEPVQQLYQEFISLIDSQGHDVNVSFQMDYIAWARLRNFAVLQAQNDTLHICLNLPLDAVSIEEMQYDFVRNNSVNELAFGSIELIINNSEELMLSSDLIVRAYKFN